MNTEPLKQAINFAGGQTNLAKSVGLSQPYIWNWLNRDQSVPAEYVIPVSRATNWKVTPNQLRPDIYPNPADGLPEEHALGAQTATVEAIKPPPTRVFTPFTGGGYIYSCRGIDRRNKDRRETERRESERRNNERRAAS